MQHLLIIEDDVAFCKMLETFLGRKGYAVRTAFNAQDARDRFIEVPPPDLVITDMRLPDADGLTLLREAKKLLPVAPVILMTGYAEVNTAVAAMKEGAFDYISKPVRPDELLQLIEKALTQNIIAAPIAKIPEPKINTPTVESIKSGYIKGVSDASNKLNDYINLVAPTTMSVLIMGESGTGKEYVARNIHDRSKRTGRPFVAVDCGAITRELATSEFFGHVKGSFTGAVNDKTGHFEAAHTGTLFLDEIGNLSYELQVQLLRALQERRIKPVGGNIEIEVDIRVVVATNENLEQAVKEGNFREDLYHRLNEFSIEVPRLADRREDILFFANVFLAKANESLEKNILGFDEVVTQKIKAYAWPGNLRELQNVIKRAVLLENSQEIRLGVLPRELAMAKAVPAQEYGLFKSKNEEEMILDALEQTNGNKSKAARVLHVDRKTLYNKLKQYGIDL